MSVGAGVTNGWRSVLPHEPAALGVSVVMHVAVLSAFLFSFSRPADPPRPQVEVKSFDISLFPGDAAVTPVPMTAAPSSDATADASSDPAAPDKPSSGSAAGEEQGEPSSGSQDVEDGLRGGIADDGGTIWTPPAPTPNAPPDDASRGGKLPVRVVLPQVQLGKGASDPLLLSYDQGRWSDALSLTEARAVASQGRITMSVSVDVAGAVSRCDVVVTSGSRIFDQRACELVGSYSYRPAQDAAGRPHPAIVSEVLEWSRDGFKSAGESSRP